MKTERNRRLLLGLAMPALILSAPMVAIGSDSWMKSASPGLAGSGQLLQVAASCPGVALRTARFAGLLADPDFQRAHPQLVDAHRGLLEELGLQIVVNRGIIDRPPAGMIRKSI